MAVGDPLEPYVPDGRMTAARKPAAMSELMVRLGHDFARPALLEGALTHPSLAGHRTRKKNTSSAYERLEFLGDRVLGLVMAEWLFARFPESSEGDLAKRHAALVNRDALRVVAQEIGLGSYLHLAHGEEAEGARKNIATLPDAMEAVIGALYLDGGLPPSTQFIQRYWQKEIEIAEAPADPKTVLQEWAQGHGLPLPQYKVVEHSGPAHAPKFTIEVSVKGHPAAVASGDSKRAAEKAAARALIDVIKKP